MKEHVLRKSECLFLLVVLLSGLFLPKLHSQEDGRNNEKIKKVNTIVTKRDINSYVVALQHKEKFDYFRKKIKSTPKYLLPYIGKYLVRQMDNLEKAKIYKYNHEPGTHDLGIVAGRSAWFFEAAFDVDIPNITNNTSKKKARKIKAQAKSHWKKFIENLRQKEKEEHKDTNHEKRVSRLKEKFKDKIKPGIHQKKYMEYKKAMLDLLDQWMPIGKNIEDLAEIIGEKPEKERDNLYNYTFDSGFNATIFRFKTNKKGEIRYVYVK